MAECLVEFKLKNPSDAAQWEILLSSFPTADVYHRAPYVLASSEIERSEPIGLAISVAGRQFLVPTLVRTISGSSEQLWNDSVSPYGYGGLICEPFDGQPEVL